MVKRERLFIKLFNIVSVPVSFLLGYNEPIWLAHSDEESEAGDDEYGDPPSPLR
jgi:hypothetical protein